MKKLSLVGIIALGLFLMVGPAAAVTDTINNFTINAAIGSHAKLSFSSTTINFPDTDPDTASVPATENALTVTSKVRKASGNATLTCQAGGDLTSGSNTIPISNVTWTATGAGYSAGTMNTAVQTPGTFAASGTYAGTFSYFLANSWSYVAASYAATVTYTLTAP